MDIIIQLFSDYTFQVVALGAGILGAISGMIGTFAILREQSLLGDGVAHGALPGVILVFLVIGTKNTELLLLGGLISGLVSAYLVSYIVYHSKIKFDGALALILSSFFGGAMVLLTVVQKIPNANQAGLEKFIYGATSSMLKRDVIIITLVSLILLIITRLLWKYFKLLSFDPLYGLSLGWKMSVVEKLLTLLVISTVIVGLQTVGAILMSAMLISPGVCARRWVNSLEQMVILSGVIGGISALLGTLISSLISKLPTGPTIVIVMGIFTVFSLLFGLEGGIIPTYRKKIKQRKL